MKQGQKTGNKQFRIYYLKKEEQCAKIGISISKKKGNAVARNYIKRQIKVMMTSIIEFENLPMILSLFLQPITKVISSKTI